MKNMYIGCMILCFSILQGCFYQENKREIDKFHSEIGKVFYIPFDIDFAVGKPESEFETLSFCNARIEHNDFIKLLTVTDDLYQTGDPRVKIIFKDNIYYINREGVVTDFKQTYSLKSKDQLYMLIKDSLHPHPSQLNSQSKSLCQ